MKCRYWGIAVVATIITGCSDQPPTRGITVPTHLSATLNAQPDTSDLVLTPNGYYHRSCVYEVPEGARKKGGVIVRRDGTSYSVPACLQPGPAKDGLTNAPGRSRDGVVPSTHGWVAFGYRAIGSGLTIRHVGARWVVPQRPATYNGTNFLFPGAQNSNTIVQPVLQYGASSAGGGQYWSVTGWMCGPTCAHGVLQTVYVGDVLGGTVDATNCSGGGCDWAITVVDSTLSHSTTLLEDAGALGGTGETNDNYTWATGGALEIWNMTQCTDLTGGQHLFSQISFRDNNGNAFTPTWYAGSDTAVTPHCGYGMSSTASANVTVLDSLAPLLTVQISGPTGVPYDSSGTWSPYFGLSGTSPYTYQWTGILSGTASSISGVPAASGYLYLQVWDSAGNTATASLHVTVCDPSEFTC